LSCHSSKPHSPSLKVQDPDAPKTFQMSGGPGPETGKMAWSYQTSPHDAHEWDGTEAPVLFDAPWQGKPRKLVTQAARNGCFFVLDRATGQLC